MNEQSTESSKKNLMAFACIGVAVAGLILGFMVPTPVANTFSPGSLISFLAFLLSLGCVKDKGNNLPAILAFTVSSLAMSISIFCSGMAA